MAIRAGARQQRKIGFWTAHLEEIKEAAIVEAIVKTERVQAKRAERRGAETQKAATDDTALELEGASITLGYQLAKARAEITRLQKRLEQTRSRLIQSSKLTGLGELSAGVAHELKQPLMVIKGLARNILKDTAITGSLAEKLRLITEASDRMEEMICHVGVYARADRPGSEPVDVNEVVRGAFLMLRDMLHTHSVRVETDLRPLPTVSGFPNRLEQVIINLSVNARDAMPAGGILSVATRARERRGRPHALITVTDTGHGIPEELASKIFDPFFTTKPAGQGTGLGLSISREIVREHKGEIECESSDGAGATFRVWLPAT